MCWLLDAARMRKQSERGCGTPDRRVCHANGGGERVFNSRECFETGIGTGIAVGTAPGDRPPTCR